MTYPPNHPQNRQLKYVDGISDRSIMGLKKSQRWVKLLVSLEQSKFVQSHHDLWHVAFVHMATNLGPILHFHAQANPYNNPTG